MDYATTPAPTNEEAVRHLDYARNRAAIALDHVLFALHLKALEPGQSIKQLVEMGEHFYKISGLGAKQTAAAAAPLRVSFNFGAKPGEKEIAGEVVVETLPADDVLSLPPNLPVMMFTMDNALDCDTDE
jgi:hypothetical protein